MTSAKKKAAARKAREAAEREVALGRWLKVVGVAAAVIVALCVNILASRHYRRWDATETGLYTLSRVTEDALKRLTEPVEIYVLLSSGDGLTLTLRHLLEAYRAITPQLQPTFIDPDQAPAEFLAVQQKYGVNAAKTEGGRVVTDANLIVVKGERKHFITADELFAVESGDALEARPQVEKVLTGAILAVSRGAPTQLCFTSGYGEPDFDAGGPEGLLGVRSRLDKLNYEAAVVPPVREGGTLEGCDGVVVAGPALPMDEADVRRLVRYVERGGNAFVFVGPELAESGGFVNVGLDPLLALAGVKKRDDIIFELEPSRKWPVGQGEAFLASPKRHAITEGLIELEGAIGVVITVASSLAVDEKSGAAPSILLSTSDEAFGMKRFEAWAQSRLEPEPSGDDARGPLIVATATELPRTDPKAAHGPRIVVMSTKSAVLGANWSNERLQGTGLFVESAMSWLVAQPVVLDIPKKPSRPVAAGLTEELLSSAALKVIGFLPLSVVLLGVAVNLRRRASEGRARRQDDEPPTKDEADGAEEDDA